MKKIGLLLCVACMFFVGCGESLIEMSEEQADVATTYAAGTLLKFSTAGKHGLIYLDPSVYEETEEEETTTIEEEPMEEPEEEASGDSTEYLTDDTETTVAATVPLSEVYNFDGATISFDGYDKEATYMQGDYFSLTPASGKIFLVLHFTLTNDTGEPISVNVPADNVTFGATVNGATLEAEQTLILEEDLTSFVGDLSAGESKDVILILEAEESKISEVESISLRATVEGTTGSMELQ